MPPALEAVVMVDTAAEVEGVDMVAEVAMAVARADLLGLRFWASPAPSGSPGQRLLDGVKPSEKQQRSPLLRRGKKP